MNRFRIISCCTALSLVMLTACGNGSATENTDSTDTTFTESEAASLSEAETADTYSEDEPASDEEASAIDTSEMLSQMINESHLPEISITDASTHDEIMQAGKRAAVFFAEAADKYFGYGVERRWKLGQTDDDILTTEEMMQYQTSGSYGEALDFTPKREMIIFRWTAQGLSSSLSTVCTLPKRDMTTFAPILRVHTR